MKKFLGIGVIIISIILVFIFFNTQKSLDEVIIPVEEAGELSGILDLESSSVIYTGYGIGKEHVGEFPLSSDSTIALGDQGQLVSGSLVLDMTGMTADSTMLLNHLKSADFFDIENHPTATYVISEIIPTPLDPDNDIIINGDLTLRDQTHPHNIVATYVQETGLLQFSTTIDRTKWDISFNSSQLGEFGDSLIRDDVRIDATIDID